MSVLASMVSEACAWVRMRGHACPPVRVTAQRAAAHLHGPLRRATPPYYVAYQPTTTAYGGGYRTQERSSALMGIPRDEGDSAVRHQAH